MEHSVFLLSGSAFVFALSLFYAFTNGLRNAPLVVATVISTRAISPGRAFLLCAASEFAGTLFLGSAVVATINRDMFGGIFHQGTPHAMLLVLASTVIGAILWGGICYARAIPSSNSHALLGGFTGSAWGAWGVDHLFTPKLITVFAVLVLTPIGVLILSAVVTKLARWAGEWMTPGVVPFADGFHVFSSMLAAGADGSNNGQMSISVTMLAWGLMESSLSPSTSSFAAPLWIKLTVACCISLGVLMGGRRIIKKLGMSFYRIEIVQGLSAQLTSAAVMLGCILHGYPASTSQVVTGSILGAGVAKNPRDVRWALASDIAISWVVTFPAVGLISLVIYKAAFWMGTL